MFFRGARFAKTVEKTYFAIDESIYLLYNYFENRWRGITIAYSILTFLLQNGDLMKKITLVGIWRAEYLGSEPYKKTIEPKINSSSKLRLPVPAYWEDLSEIFAEAGIADDISYNPLYEIQRYPQTGYVKDMALKNPLGCFIYTRSFSLTEIFDNAEIWFGGVQNRVSAWINGVYVGEHEGYSSSFAFSIPAGLLRVGENSVTLAVSNNRLSGYMERPVSGLTSRAANECSGGIYGDVEICFYPDGLRDAWVRCANDLTEFSVCFDGAKDKKKCVRIFDGEAEIICHQADENENSVTISAVGLKHWSPSEPYLYRAVAETENQSISFRFGIRGLTASGTKLYLNGEPYYFLGTCEHCYHPITVHPTRDVTYYKNVINTLKSFGFNSIRFHTYIPPVEYIEAADELGMLLELETPNNTTYSEWVDIVKMARKYTSPLIYSSGNEMVIDEDYIEHLRACANLVHNESDALFSPMSAMRGIEYFSYGDTRVDEPFPHNPKRLAALGEFSDLYNTYSLGLTSYESDIGDPKILDERNAIYKKPLLTHEICINGTYQDLSLKDRYEGSRIGETEIFTSVEEHLKEKGLLDRADIYYKNSALWQSVQRKNCFETVRLTESFAGYDFLGDIDTHWHTFGYCVGMMNEFYELKPGETRGNVLRYNSPAVLLAALPKCRSFNSGEKISIPILISNYLRNISDATLAIRVSTEEASLFDSTLSIADIPSGMLSKLYDLELTIPELEYPKKLTIAVDLHFEDRKINNEWDIYAYPKIAKKCANTRNMPRNVYIKSDISANELLEMVGRGDSVVLFGRGPFSSEPASFQLSIAGRTHGHLATVIHDHPLTRDIPHDNFCSMQYREMMNGSSAIILDNTSIPFSPIIEIATSYKNAKREALMAEYRVGDGKLLIVGLNLEDTNPGAVWLRERIIFYAGSEEFNPKVKISTDELKSLFGESCHNVSNDNAALNKNDITM